jgi:hypothetical protein
MDDPDKDPDILEVVEEDEHEYRLKWWIPENGDYGATVGESGTKPVKEKDTDIEWYTAEIVAHRLLKAKPDSDVFGLDKCGFWWSSKSAAATVLRQIRNETQLALRLEKESKDEWPEWAVTAAAAGWKPPKVWKP